MELLSLCYQHSALIAAGILAYYGFTKVTAYFRLSQFGGDKWTGLSDWPHSRAMLQHTCHEWYAESNNKYGPLARVAPNVLVTSSPEAWSHVNKDPAYKRTDWYYHALRLEYQRDNVFCETNNEIHDARRLKMIPGYSGRENLALESSIDERIQEFLSLIRSKYISSNDGIVLMDLARKVQYLTLDVISGVGLGKTFGMLESDSDVDDYLKSSEEGLVMAQVVLATGLSKLIQAAIIGKYIAPSPKDKKGFGRMMSTCFKYVDERLSNPTDKRSDMLASFVRHGITGAQLRSEALAQIIAGSDTTAGGIRGTLLHVMTNPRVYARLQTEIDQVVRDGRAANGDIISYANAKQLPYLDAVTREALRIWPPVANAFLKTVPDGGDNIPIDSNGGKVFVPGGVDIGYSAHAMHHSRELYGEDTDVFRPERWLNADPVKREAMVRTNNLVFGHGRFGCLGKPVALIETAKVIFELFRNFDIALVNPTRPWKASNVNGLFIISDMWVQVFERECF